MDKEKVQEYIITHRRFFANEDLFSLRYYLENLDVISWNRVLSLSLQDPDRVRVVSIFAGPIGVDRFMIGDVVGGVIKTLTCGGFGIWAIIDWFLISNAAKEKNHAKLASIL